MKSRSWCRPAGEGVKPAIALCRPAPSTNSPNARTAILSHPSVRLCEDRRGNTEAEGLGRLGVDDQLELPRVLHGQLRRFLTLQDAVDVVSAPLECLRQLRSVGHEASVPAEYPEFVHRGQAVHRRE